jgi:hypothetical protein
MLIRQTLLRSCTALITCFLLTHTASAGLPLVCAPFDAGNAEVLPWDKPSSPFTTDPNYSINRLTSDTLRLLSPQAPTVARMENLRRATIYASKDRAVANALLKAVLERTRRLVAEDPHIAALTWFDAGYLVETYRQWSLMRHRDMLAAFDKAHPGLRREVGALDGYDLVAKAAAATHEPQMKVAASLMAQRR